MIAESIPPPPHLVHVAPPRSRRRRHMRVQIIPAFWAVSCCVCAAIGPAATTRERGLNPPKRSGWRYIIVHGISGWWCRSCLRTRNRLLPPATRAGCAEGPRPCKRVLCRYHLVYDISRKAKDDFTLPESCALDVADSHEEGLTLREVGALLGMTREGAREILEIAKAKTRHIPTLRELAGALEVDE